MRRRQFLQAGLVGTVAMSGCSGVLLSDSRRQGDEANTTSNVTLGGDSPSEATASPGRDPPKRSGHYLSGIYNGKHQLELGRLNEWLGHRPAVVMIYVNALTGTSWVDRFLRTHMTEIWNQGHIPILVWKPIVTYRKQTPEDIEVRIAKGEFDDIINVWATRLASWVKRDSSQGYRRRFYFLPAHEMNGNWNPWSAVNTDSRATTTGKAGVPEDYATMWRHIHDIFSNTDLDEQTIQWMWVPNASEVGDARTERYYPGDEYVDWIGLNGYNYGDINSDSWWRTPAERFTSMVRRMRKLADKPLAIPETSTTSYVNGAFRPHRKTEWIRRLFSFAEDERIQMVGWFNHDDAGRWETDWAVFGGAHGSSTTHINGNTYRIYDEYKRQIESPSTLNARTDHPRLLTDNEFAGRF